MTKSAFILIVIFTGLIVFYALYQNNDQEIGQHATIRQEVLPSPTVDQRPAMPQKELATPQPVKSTIEVEFSPQGGATYAIVRFINEAKKYVHIAAYDFTSKDVAFALINAHRRGVDVTAVLDKENDKVKYTAAVYLVDEHVPTRIDSRYAIMHNKFIVIDGISVETGSFNYTIAAEKHNAENVIILRNYPDVARQYEQRWLQLWQESSVYE